MAGAADPITTAQNSTSNCWPILPKQYDLALVNSVISPVSHISSMFLTEITNWLPRATS
jgi:hypothetical protein